MFTPAQIGAAGSFMQGLGALGIGSSDNYGRQWDNTKGLFYENERIQKEFAQNGVRWKVEDARRAGIHPLAALGMPAVQAGSFGIQPGEGVRENRLSSAGRTMSEYSASQAQLRMAEATVKRDLAQASYYEALAHKAKQDSVARPAFPENTVKINPVDPVRHVDWVKLEADPVMASSSLDPGTTAGVDHPGMRQFTFPGGFKALLPATGGGGVPEEIDVSMLPIVIGANVNRYGAKWPLDLLEYMVTGGKEEKLSPGGERLRKLFRQGK